MVYVINGSIFKNRNIVPSLRIHFFGKVSNKWPNLICNGIVSSDPLCVFPRNNWKQSWTNCPPPSLMYVHLHLHLVSILLFFPSSFTRLSPKVGVAVKVSFRCGHPPASALPVSRTPHGSLGLSAASVCTELTDAGADAARGGSDAFPA